MDVDTGEVAGPHVEAAVTVTFGTHKIAHLVDPAARACGAVHLVDIGLDLPPAPVLALQASDVAALLPVPDAAGHKYTRGVVGVRAGSAQYPGAGVLCVSGASTGLVGMVRYDGGADALVHASHPEVVVGAGQVQAWVVGSGGGADAAKALARSRADGVPLVVDADGLASVDGPLDVPALLTPHAGELARMLGVDRAEVEAAPLRSAPGRGPVRGRRTPQGPAHAGRRARRAGRGHHGGAALARDRRVRGRARRAVRGAARGGADAVRRGGRRVVAPRRRRGDRRRAADR